MSKYVYPAIFAWNDEDQVYYVTFPDAKNWFTDGSTVAEAMENATDVLNLMLLHLEESHRENEIPKPSNINDLQKTNPSDIVTLRTQKPTPKRSRFRKTPSATHARKQD